jgi:hypothetical protein
VQQFFAFLSALFIMFSGLFPSLPHTLRARQTPERTITETTRVLALYQDVAAQNANTKFRAQIKMLHSTGGDPKTLSGNATKVLDASSKLLYNMIAWKEVVAGHAVKGIAGDARKLAAADLKSAKANYYANGKTLELTLQLKDQAGDSKRKAVANAMGEDLADSYKATVALAQKQRKARGQDTEYILNYSYKEPQVRVVVNTKTGKIVAANASCRLLIDCKLESKAAGLHNQPFFQQELLYTVKRP